MKLLKIAPAIAVAALAIPCFSFAQATDTPSEPAPAAQTDSMSSQPAGAYSAAQAGVNTSTGPIPADQLPPGQARALAAGDNQLVANQPIPDTKANRAKYGGPMSNGGRRTAPVGN